MRVGPIVAAALVAGALPIRGAAAVAPEDPAAFMARTARQDGVVTTASGLEYLVVRPGPAAGRSPQLTDVVKVNYEGRLLDGSVFDSSYAAGMPAVLPVSRLVPAWTEALQLMKPGDVWTLYVPPDLGYGPEGRGPIPPNSVMIFKLELLEVLPASSGG